MLQTILKIKKRNKNCGELDLMSDKKNNTTLKYILLPKEPTSIRECFSNSYTITIVIS